MKQRILSMVLAIALMVGVMPTTVFAGTPKGEEVILEANNTLSIPENEIATYDSITVTGNSTINLGDNCVLTVDGVFVADGATLTINGGSEGTGSLISTVSTDGKAAIGGQGTVIINGGVVKGEVTCSRTAGDGIGSNYRIVDYGTNVTTNYLCTIIINGGSVTGTSTNGAGIGGNVTINGGTVAGTSSASGAGIGSGADNTCTVTINGGTVSGTSIHGAGVGSGSSRGCILIVNEGTVSGTSKYGAGVGSGLDYATSSVTINGGSVTGISTDGAGVGGGDGSSCTSKGTVVIDGGTVTGTSTNGDGIGNGVTNEISVKQLVSVTIKSGTVTGTSTSGTIGILGYDGTDRTITIEKVSSNNESNDESNGGSNDDSSNNSSLIIPQWIPTTPEEIRAFTLFGLASDVADDDFYEILNDDIATMARMVQGPKCIAVMDANAPYGMELVRTYGILLPGFSLDNIIYTSDKELEVVLKIPTSLQEEGATFKMICVSEEGMPYILDDLDTDPTTITFKTDKFYAFGLYKSINN